jgi:hypothetical protein
MPAIRTDRPALSDKAIRACQYRMGLFERRGWTPERAAAWADRLIDRDADRDDRRLCIECANFQRGGWCGRAAAVLGYRPKNGRPASLQLIPDLLQRCPHFAFQKP